MMTIFARFLVWVLVVVTVMLLSSIAVALLRAAFPSQSSTPERFFELCRQTGGEPRVVSGTDKSITLNCDYPGPGEVWFDDTRGTGDA